MDELFSVPENLSPRLKWMREHGITTTKTTVTVEKDAVRAQCGNKTEISENELDALTALAKRLKIRLWNGA